MKILSFDVGIINLAYCIFDTELKKILHWEIINNEIGGKFNARISSSGVSDLYLNLIKNLDKRPQLLDVDLVLIEKQPSFNPKMRIIAGCLQTYFYIRGVVDKSEHKINSVEFFSPKNKLKCYTGPELDISSKNGKIVKGKYAQTKKTGILIARIKLEENSETKEICDMFENSKKKDDLSDCYLQVLTYVMFSKNLNTINVVNVIKTVTKKDLKEYLDNQIKNCSVIELMEKDFKTIGQINLPDGINANDIESILSKWSMKKYLKFKYL